jgi:hypothetical protein
MSFTATRWAWSQPTGRSSSKLVLLALADRADDAGMAYPSIATLAADTDLDRKTVMPALAHLERLGLVVCARGVGKSTRYQLILTAVTTVEPVPKTGQVQEAAPVPKTGPTSPKNGTRTYQEPITNLKTPFIPPPQPSAEVVADATVVEPTSKPKAKKPQTLPAGFEDFWAAYPRKQAKQAALKAWTKIKPSPELLDRILADVRHRHQHDPGWHRGFTPHPATYLNGARWEDDLTPTNGDDRHAGPRESAAEKWDRLNRTPLADLFAEIEPATAERAVAGEVISGHEGGVRGQVVVPISHARGYGGPQNRVVGTYP